MKEMCELLKIAPSDEQLTAGRYLETRGKRFCCEFGYENAVQMADELFDEECANVERLN